MPFAFRALAAKRLTRKTERSISRAMALRLKALSVSAQHRFLAGLTGAEPLSKAACLAPLSARDLVRVCALRLDQCLHALDKCLVTDIDLLAQGGVPQAHIMRRLHQPRIPIRCATVVVSGAARCAPEQIPMQTVGVQPSRRVLQPDVRPVAEAKSKT